MPIGYASGSVKAQGQQLDALNTKAIGLLDASPGAPWVGGWTQTRADGITRQLTVVAGSTLTACGGIFTFQFSEDGVNPTITESRPIADFSTVRDFDLINAGAFFRVKFEPSRILVPTELIFVTTTQRSQYDGDFVRLATQEIEAQNAAFGQVFAYIRAFNPSGKSIGIQADATGRLATFLPSSQQVNVGNFPTTQLVGVKPNDLAVTAVGAAGAAVTLTLPAVAAQFHNIAGVEITMYSTAARAGSATPVTVTTTNLPGTPAFTFPSAGAIGTITTFLSELSRRSTVVNTATTIVCPATTSVIWRINVSYYTTP